MTYEQAVQNLEEYLDATRHLLRKPGQELPNLELKMEMSLKVLRERTEGFVSQ
jgi:predicted RNase H-like HicB family nuclease